LWLVWGLWNKREEMKAQYGELAYQKMIPRGLTGISLVLTVALHAFTSVRSLPPSAPVNDLTIQWSRSLLPLIGVAPGIELWIRLILSGFILLLALLTVRSALFTFGVDYMAVVYLYFPEESEIQEHEIYSVIRHPTYLGGFLIGLSAIFFRFSVYSIIIGLLLCLVWRLQAWKEEKELIERFGEGYIEYKNRVPAFIVRPGKIRAYLRFLRSTV
jgi:protein-S-isoprenylcysteine O-methyltransferase Ste14